MGTKGEQTRKEIIEAAKLLFYRRGFGQTSFSDIVDRTGIRRGNINHYFRTKQDILEAVVEHRASEYRAMLSDWNARHGGTGATPEVNPPGARPAARRA